MEISFLLLTSFGGVGVLLFLIFIFVKSRASQEDNFGKCFFVILNLFWKKMYSCGTNHCQLSRFF